MAMSRTYVAEIALKGSGRKTLQEVEERKPPLPGRRRPPHPRCQHPRTATGTPTVPSNPGTTHAEVYKEKREIDDEKMTVTSRGLEGHVMEQFKEYDIIFQFIQKSKEGCVCKLTLVWEKRNEDVPEPISYTKLLKSLVADMGDHILKDQN
ncbi:hypothetical protein Bca101_065821 [Brassica carinata]